MVEVEPTIHHEVSSHYVMLHGYLRWQNLCQSFLTPSLNLLAYSLCVCTHTEI